MNAPQYIPSFYFYKFAQGISEPYTSLQAYHSGVIDASGNVLKPESSIEPLEYLIIKLKKIFEQLPAGMTKSKLNNFLSTLQMFGEEVEWDLGITPGEYSGLIESQLILKGYTDINYVALHEDMGAGGMAAPADSPNYNQGGVSGTDPVMGLQRRSPVLKGLDSCEMFDVCPEEYRQLSGAKSWKEVPDSDTKEYIKRFAQRSGKRVAIRSVDPDSGQSNLFWLNYPAKSFMETYNIDEKKMSLLAEAETDPLDLI